MSSGTAGRSGASIVADMLHGYGVTHVFMVPAILRHTFAELERRYPQIARVATHGEKSAAYMADGYARASGRPGVCAAQVVGALNLAAGLREPFLAGSPVVALTGGRLPATMFRQVYQEADDLPAFGQVTKYNAVVADAGRFPDMIRQAFRVATTGCPGPVHLQVQGNEGQLDAEVTDAEPLAEPAFAAVPPFRPEAEEASVAAAVRLLRAAARPVIVAGGGVRASQAGGELVALAEALAVPVVTSANGKDTIPGTHPLAAGVVGTYSRETANQVTGRADLVCFIGTRTGGMTTHFWAVPPIGTPAIQIDIEPAHLGRNYPLEAAVLGDARSVLRQMLRLAGDGPRPARDGWLAEVAQLKAAWRDKYRDVMTSEEVPMRPERICAELSAFLPADGIAVVDTGHAGMWMGQFFDITAPTQSYLRSAGHLGWAFSAGIGAKCAAPDRPVFTFTGDSGLYYHLGEIETAVRWGVNLITVVNNNHGGNQSKRGFDRAYGGQATDKAAELWTYRDIRFAGIAEQMGALGISVDKPADLAPAFDRALSARRPVVIDVRTDIDIAAPPPVS
ncbi:MAG TPA: thiamine pyrophosphate-binding protein [Trebonia sp.]